KFCLEGFELPQPIVRGICMTCQNIACVIRPAAMTGALVAIIRGGCLEVGHYKDTDRRRQRCVRTFAARYFGAQSMDGAVLAACNFLDGKPHFLFQADRGASAFDNNIVANERRPSTAALGRNRFSILVVFQEHIVLRHVSSPTVKVTYDDILWFNMDGIRVQSIIASECRYTQMYCLQLYDLTILFAHSREEKLQTVRASCPASGTSSDKALSVRSQATST